MKKFLTESDYQKLSDPARAWLFIECSKIGKRPFRKTGKLAGAAILPKLDIPDLIDILMRNSFFDVDDPFQNQIHVDLEGWHVQGGAIGEVAYKHPELIYALWEAVVDICGKEE